MNDVPLSPRAEPSLASKIADNLARLHERIATAAQRAGRDPATIRLIAVSKSKPKEMVQAAIRAGQRDFGESTLQDAHSKIPYFTDPAVSWHFIGHLQSNKAKHIPRLFDWIHSVDSLALAERPDRLGQAQAARLKVLLQVNITRDPAKYGLAPEAVFDTVQGILAAEPAGIRLRGLMAIGPPRAREPELRAAFARLRALRDACVQRFALGEFTELSMGMSADYLAAIREGATMLRIGTAIFGER